MLNKETSTWESVTFSGRLSSMFNSTWTDGENIYYFNSSNNTNLVLDKTTRTWTATTFVGTPRNFTNLGVWTDGNNIYYSLGNTYVLDKETRTWTQKEIGMQIYTGKLWTDGDNIYYSDGSNQYVLNVIEKLSVKL